MSSRKLLDKRQRNGTLAPVFRSAFTCYHENASKEVRMTKSERREFRAFCEQASAAQLLAIVERERAAAKGSEYRAICAGIAESVAAARGLVV